MNISRSNYPKPGKYCKLWRRVLAAPEDQPVDPRFAWDWGYTIPEIKRRFHKAVHARINSRGGIDQPRGRDDCADHFWAAWRDSRKANSRVIIRQFETREARRRLAHRIYNEREDY